MAILIPKYNQKTKEIEDWYTPEEMLGLGFSQDRVDQALNSDTTKALNHQMEQKAIQVENGDLDKKELSPVDIGWLSRQEVDLKTPEQKEATKTEESSNQQALEGYTLSNKLLERDLKPVTGLFRVRSGIPGTIAHDTDALRKQLVSQLSLKQVDKLRGTGAISDAEQALLASAATILSDPGVTEEAAQAEIERVNKIFGKAAGIEEEAVAGPAPNTQGNFLDNVTNPEQKPEGNIQDEVTGMVLNSPVGSYFLHPIANFVNDAAIATWLTFSPESRNIQAAQQAAVDEANNLYDQSLKTEDPKEKEALLNKQDGILQQAKITEDSLKDLFTADITLNPVERGAKVAAALEVPGLVGGAVSAGKGAATGLVSKLFGNPKVAKEATKFAAKEVSVEGVLNLGDDFVKEIPEAKAWWKTARGQVAKIKDAQGLVKGIDTLTGSSSGGGWETYAGNEVVSGLNKALKEQLPGIWRRRALFGLFKKAQKFANFAKYPGTAAAFYLFFNSKGSE